MKKANFFWVSFSDLMMSLFFIMLVLSAISFVLFTTKTKQLEETILELNRKDSLIQIQAKKYQIIESVESNLEPLKRKSELFYYEEKFKRYKLAFDIQFREARVRINEKDVKNFAETSEKIKKVGLELKSVVEGLIKKREEEPEKYKDISYLIVVAGSASKLPDDNPDKNYMFSYNRAYNLYKYWRDSLEINFDAPEYHDFIEFQIAGNGEGGVGRYPNNPANDYKSERRNQTFLINIIPKIGEL
jgi:hypothetical protein